MIIESEAVGPFFKNGFVVGCETTRDAVLIDPGTRSRPCWRPPTARS